MLRERVLRLSSVSWDLSLHFEKGTEGPRETALPREEEERGPQVDYMKDRQGTGPPLTSRVRSVVVGVLGYSPRSSIVPTTLPKLLFLSLLLLAESRCYHFPPTSHLRTLVENLPQVPQ